MLENKTYELLKELYKNHDLTFSQIGMITGEDESKAPSKHISVLFRHGFISNWNPDGSVSESGEELPKGYSITLDGTAYVQQRWRDKRNFIVPYVITTALALLSLIASLAEHWDVILSWFCACSRCK